MRSCGCVSMFVRLRERVRAGPIMCYSNFVGNDCNDPCNAAHIKDILDNIKVRPLPYVTLVISTYVT